MKTAFIIPALLLCTVTARSQQVVFDPSVVSTLVMNHNIQNTNLSLIKDNEGAIAATQALISTQMDAIRIVEQKMHNSLYEVQGIITGAKGIIRASEIVADIAVYQSDMIDIAGQDAKLGLVAAKTEYLLVQRTGDLFEYIYYATVGGDINLMNNKERLDLITHVVNELRVMRGMAYTIAQKMKRARYAGILRYMIPEDLRPMINTTLLVDETIQDAKDLLRN